MNYSYTIIVCLYSLPVYRADMYGPANNAGTKAGNRQYSALCRTCLVPSVPSGLTGALYCMYRSGQPALLRNRRSRGNTTVAGDHSKQDLRQTQKPIYSPIFTFSIWSCLLWSPVIPCTAYGVAPMRSTFRAVALDFLRAVALSPLFRSSERGRGGVCSISCMAVVVGGTR